MKTHPNDSMVPLTMDREKLELARYYDALEGKTKYSQLPEMTHNPFLCNIIEDIKPVFVRYSKSDEIIQAVGVDNQEMITLKQEKVFKRSHYVDRAKYTKVYTRYLSDMFSLSSTGLKLFGYFISEMEFNDDSDMVYMNVEDGMKFCGYSSKAMIYRGLFELILKGFICKTNKLFMFYVNPKYAFKGDRCTVIDEYILKDMDPAQFNNPLKSIDRGPEHDINDDFD